MSSTEVTYRHGEDCCACQCAGPPLGCGGCLMTLCCPCFALCLASQESKVDDYGVYYCLSAFVPCGLVASTMILGMNVEEKRGIKKHGPVWHFCNTIFNTCTCHGCRVINECKVYQAEGAVNTSAPKAAEIDRK